MDSHLKCLKVDQYENWYLQFNQNGHCELFMFEYSVHIFRTWFLNTAEDESNHKYLEYNSP